jgi:crotonobetainyl-CoA:carnitine CoA-transferase CaiB-like acyl-CoA transferase
MSSALEGIRILDLTRLLPGPYASLMLADLGAEVVKIEDPRDGKYIRWRWAPSRVKEESPYFLSLNRNKKSMKLNLRSDKGREIFLKLAKNYDVILDGFRPGVMDRLSVGYKDVKKVNPRIIFCAITGYGQDGPYKDRAGHDINYTGVAGILSMTGDRDGPPIISGVQIADIGGGGMLAAFAILAAIIAREKMGRGQFIDISMLDGSIACSVIGLAKFFADGQIPEKGKMLLSGQLACYHIYQTKDKGYISLGALEHQSWQNFCKVVGKEDLIKDQFASGERQDEVISILTNIFSGRSSNGR